ncbi:condensation domain-containing protein [Nocardiopsis sp. YSL2]|uniref:condensation domain-containing protein n=1 Tax=Nocardiopsis sp. YSL2 TaxID=2939492 RepID=UPI0026F45056|nr:condensation domain-containing protein [Nocardiopsis sp. YSL2]
MATTRVENFEGFKDRHGPLTWGQRHYWTILAGHPMNRRQFSLRQHWRIPAGANLELVCSAVRTLVERHEALRTHIFFHGDGEPIQRVRGCGSFQITVRDVGHEATEADAEEAAGDMAAQDFRLNEEFPIRFQVLLADGEPVFLAVVVSHLAVDGYACGVLEGEFMEVVRGDKDLAPPSKQPLDWAEKERSSAGASVNRRSLTYFDELLRAHPVSLFPRDNAMENVGREGFPVVLGHGVGLGAKISELSGRWKSPVSAVALASLVRSLAHHSATDVFPLGLTSSNRFLPGADGYVGMLAQNTALGVRTAGKSTRELAGEIRRSQMAAYQSAAYDQGDLDALLEVAHPGADRVGFGAVSHFVNFQHGYVFPPRPDGIAPELPPYFLWHGDRVPYEIPRFGIIISSDDHDLGVRIFADPAALPVSKVESIIKTFFDEFIGH